MCISLEAAWGNSKFPEKTAMSGQWSSGKAWDRDPCPNHGMKPPRITKQEGPENQSSLIYKKWRHEIFLITLSLWRAIYIQHWELEVIRYISGTDELSFQDLEENFLSGLGEKCECFCLKKRVMRKVHKEWRKKTVFFEDGPLFKLHRFLQRQIRMLLCVCVCVCLWMCVCVSYLHKYYCAIYFISKW